jgi:hypothetical protein
VRNNERRDLEIFQSGKPPFHILQKMEIAQAFFRQNVETDSKSSSLWGWILRAAERLEVERVFCFFLSTQKEKQKLRLSFNLQGITQQEILLHTTT